jgi:hypothetical protein
MIVGKGYDIKMKYHILTLFNTKRVMIAKIIMIKNRMFLLNIETNMPKCMCKL